MRESEREREREKSSKSSQKAQKRREMYGDFWVKAFFSRKHKNKSETFESSQTHQSVVTETPHKKNTTSSSNLVYK